MTGTLGKSILVAALLSGTGCTTVKKAWTDRAGYYTQNMPDLDDENVRQFARRQNNIWNCFVAMAQSNPEDYAGEADYGCRNGGAGPNQVKSGKAGALAADVAVPAADASAASISMNDRESDGTIPPYSQVVAAGINYVDVRCDRFMDALFWFNRMRETASRQIQYVGAASAAALTILKASEELIGLAPLGIGLLDQTTNNVGRGLLYDLPPHTVRVLVEKQQQAYLQAVAKEYTSRPHAMQTIQGYAALCLPATIEAEVNRAVAATEYKPVPWENPLERSQWVPSSAGTTDGSTGAPQPKRPRRLRLRTMCPQ